MLNIHVDRTKLIDVIKANKVKHVLEYKEACHDYAVDAMREINKAIDSLNSDAKKIGDGEVIKLAFINLRTVVPTSHEKDYDRAIGMLEMTTENEIRLPEEDFSKYVTDDWEWKEQWDTVRNSYSSKSGR